MFLSSWLEGNCFIMCVTVNGDTPAYNTGTREELLVTKSVDDVSRMNSSPSNAHERRASSELVIRFLIDLCSASHLA